MHLENRPTYFVKDGVRIPVYYTVDARQLTEDGWVQEGAEKVEQVKIVGVPIPITAPEPVEEKVDLTGMTKNELLDYAKANDIEVDPSSLKSAILDVIKESADG